MKICEDLNKLTANMQYILQYTVCFMGDVCHPTPRRHVRLSLNFNREINMKSTGFFILFEQNIGQLSFNCLRKTLSLPEALSCLDIEEHNLAKNNCAPGTPNRRH